MERQKHRSLDVGGLQGSFPFHAEPSYPIACNARAIRVDSRLIQYMLFSYSFKRYQIYFKKAWKHHLCLLLKGCIAGCHASP